MAPFIARTHLGDHAELDAAIQVGGAHQHRNDGEGGPVEGAIQHAVAGRDQDLTGSTGEHRGSGTP